MSWFVEVYEYENDVHPASIKKRLGPFASERLANKADAGFNINLDHEKYFTKVVEK